MQKKAVALQYQDIHKLPHVIASGAGDLAREILRTAEEFGVPVEENSKLTEMLAPLKTGAPISPETYRLVAEIICFLYRTDIEWKSAHSQLEDVYSTLAQFEPFD